MHPYLFYQRPLILGGVVLLIHFPTIYWLFHNNHLWLFALFSCSYNYLWFLYQ